MPFPKSVQCFFMQLSAFRTFQRGVRTCGVKDD